MDGQGRRQGAVSERGARSQETSERHSWSLERRAAKRSGTRARDCGEEEVTEYIGRRASLVWLNDEFLAEERALHARLANEGEVLEGALHSPRMAAREPGRAREVTPQSCGGERVVPQRAHAEAPQAGGGRRRQGGARVRFKPTGMRRRAGSALAGADEARCSGSGKSARRLHAPGKIWRR